jgi:hypothetical protein
MRDSLCFRIGIHEYASIPFRLDSISRNDTFVRSQGAGETGEAFWVDDGAACWPPLEVDTKSGHRDSLGLAAGIFPAAAAVDQRGGSIADGQARHANVERLAR